MLRASLRVYLTVWFTSLSFLTLLVVGAYVTYQGTEQMKQASGRALSSTAKSTAALLRIQLEERQREIYMLSREPDLVRGDLDSPDIRSAMELHSQSRAEYAWLGVVDTEGQVRQAVKGILQHQSVRQRPWFQAGLIGPYLGDPHEALLLAKILVKNTSDEPLRFIDLAVPITDGNGQVIGVLGAHAHWNWVTALVQSAVSCSDKTKDLEILIVDHSGRALYPETLAGQQFAHIDQSEGAESSPLKWPVDDGYVTRIEAVPTSADSDSNWFIVVRQPLDTALEPIRILVHRLMALGIFAALVFAIVAYYLALKLSKPIEQFARSARQVQTHEAGASFPVRHRVAEIAQLGQSMQNMTRSLLDKETELQQANAGLEATIAQRTVELRRVNEELLQFAIHDALTGVFNRRRLDEKLREYNLLFQRTGRPFALLLIDADHFKRINDNYGHSTGDEVLVQVASLIKQNTRATDVVARYGGEEFAVLLTEVDGENGARVAAQTICSAVAEYTFPQVGHVTVSIGIALAHPSESETAALIDRADKQLYHAKRLGRNQICSAQ